MNIPNKELTKGMSWEEYKKQFAITKSDEVYGALKHNYEVAKDSYQVLTNGAYKHLLTEINAVGKEKNDLSLDKSVADYLQEIQSLNLWTFVQKQKNKNTTNFSLSDRDADLLVGKINEIGETLYKEKWKESDAKLGLLKTLADNITKQRSGSSSVELLKCFPDQEKDLNIVTAARKVQGAINRLRGMYLEQEVVKFLEKKLPEKIVVNTGGIKVGGKSIKEDVAAFYKEFHILNEKGEIAYTFNQDGSIVNKDGETVEKVILTDTQYEELQKNMFMGVSAKASSSTIVFHGGYNINTLLEEVSENNDKIIYQLIHMYQLGSESIPQSLVIACQKYAVSKNLFKIIGKKNTFLASRTGLIPTYQYLEKLINGNNVKSLLRFRNNKLPNRTIGASLNTKFGVTDIIGSAIKK